MIRRIAALAGLAVLAACSADTTAPPSSYDVSLAVDSISMRAGDSIMPAIVVTVNGVARVPNSREVLVSSSDTSVVVVGANDALIAVGDGTAQVSVAWAATPSVAVTRLVTVVSETLSGVSLIAPSAMIPGDTTALVVTGNLPRGHQIANPATVVVTSRNPAVLVTSGNSAIAIAPGAAWIVASAASGVVDSSLVTVAVGAPAILTISPRIWSLVAGQIVRAAVTIVDRRGNVVTAVSPTFTSTALAVATVQADGTVTGVGAGSASIIASAGAAADTLRVTVSAAPAVLGRLVVSPDSVTLAPGGSASIQLLAFDAQGLAMPVPAVTWQSQTSGITVTSAGVIQAAATITTTIPNGVVRVSSSVVSAQVRVSVVVADAPPPPTDNGFVQIVWVGDTPAPTVAAAFEAARTRINGLFNSFSGVIPLDLNVPGGSCMAGSPALVQSVKGIVIFAQVTAIDGVGGILGSAGPCLVRNTTLLPIVGAMQFDAADMAAMLASGVLNGVVLHEMMHTLGFGSIWGPGERNEVAAPDGVDPRYIGTNGQAGYVDVGGLDAPSGVPVENTGGSGTRGSHWRESVFHTELMTGWADGAMQLSRATIGALKDFGYDVDLNKADPFVLPVAGIRTNLVASQLIVEQTTVPIGMVGTDGRITRYTGMTAH
ncbi:MAG TPA: leishmanolysin-related zinc metalloendopeptidase [Gemmatimonadales bacterium]